MNPVDYILPCLLLVILVGALWMAIRFTIRFIVKMLKKPVPESNPVKMGTEPTPQHSTTNVKTFADVAEAIRNNPEMMEKLVKEENAISIDRRESIMTRLAMLSGFCVVVWALILGIPGGIVGYSLWWSVGSRNSAEIGAIIGGVIGLGIGGLIGFLIATVFDWMREMLRRA